jgi:hypothetical protein
VFHRDRDGGLIIYRVLLDDVLAAVDSQVARQVFGMSSVSILDGND